MQRFQTAGLIVGLFAPTLLCWGCASGTGTPPTTRAPEPTGVVLAGEERLIPGTRYRETTEFVLEDGTMILEMLGQTLDGSMEAHEMAVVEVEVLSEDSIRLVQILNVEKEEFSILGNTQPEESHGSLEGVPVIGRRQEGRWTFTLEEGTPTEDQVTALEELADDDEDFVYPKERTEVGDSWEIDPTVIAEVMGDDLTDGSGTGTMKLVELVDHHGHPCAHLAFELRLSGEIIDDDGAPIVMAMELQGEIYRALDLLADIEVRGTGTIQGEGEFTAEELTFKMSLNGPLEVSVLREAL